MKLNLSDTMNLSDFFMKRKNEKAQYNKCSKFYFEKKKNEHSNQQIASLTMVNPVTKSLQTKTLLVATCV